MPKKDKFLWTPENVTITNPDGSKVEPTRLTESEVAQRLQALEQVRRKVEAKAAQKRELAH